MSSLVAGKSKTGNKVSCIDTFVRGTSARCLLGCFGMIRVQSELYKRTETEVMQEETGNRRGKKQNTTKKEETKGTHH